MPNNASGGGQRAPAREETYVRYKNVARQRYVQQHRTWNGWETVTDDDENPVTYPTRSLANRDLASHLEAIREAVRRGILDDHDPEDWRVTDIRVYKDNGMGDTLEFAESLGWIDENIEPWTPAAADATEASALDYIVAKGYVIDRSDQE